MNQGVDAPAGLLPLLPLAVEFAAGSSGSGGGWLAGGRLLGSRFSSGSGTLGVLPVCVVVLLLLVLLAEESGVDGGVVESLFDFPEFTNAGRFQAS